MRGVPDDERAFGRFRPHVPGRRRAHRSGEDGDEGDIHDEDTALQRAVYDWLAGVQELLVMAIRPRR